MTKILFLHWPSPYCTQSPLQCMNVSSQNPEQSGFASKIKAKKCSRPGDGFRYKGARLSPGLYYKEGDDLMTYEAAAQVCGETPGSHLPRFRTQEEFEILLSFLGEKTAWIFFSYGTSKGLHQINSREIRGAYLVGSYHSTWQRLFQPWQLQGCPGVVRRNKVGWRWLLHWLVWFTGEQRLLTVGLSFGKKSLWNIFDVPCCQHNNKTFQINKNGTIMTPEDGCIDGLAKSLCQYECSGMQICILLFGKPD